MAETQDGQRDHLFAFPGEGGNPTKTTEEAMFDLLESDPEFGNSGTDEPAGDEPASPDDEVEDPVEPTDDPEEEVEEEPGEDTQDDEVEESEDAEDTEDDETPEPELFEIPGSDTKVTREELVHGYMRQQDYTRKTTEVADRRKQVEAAEDEVSGLRHRYLGVLKQLEAWSTGASLEEPPMSLRESNPQEYAVRMADYIRERDRLRAIRSEAERVEQEQHDKDVERFNRYRETEQARLLDAIPEWREETVRTEEGAKITKWLKDTFGYADQDLQYMVDHRLIRIARDAYRYNQASKVTAPTPSTKTSSQRKTLKPGTTKLQAPTGPKGKKAKQRTAADNRRRQLRRTGSMDDAAAVMFDILTAEEEGK